MPWCPECKKFFDVKTGVCPECGELLEDRAACTDTECSGNCADCAQAEYEEEECTGNCDPGIWPIDDNGKPVKPALLTTIMGNQVDYEIAVSQLRSYGIPNCRTYPGAGQVAKVIFGFTGEGMDIYVPENMLEDARELMKPLEDDEK